MAKHLVKCVYCGETFDTLTEPYIKINQRRYAHEKCQKEQEKKKTKEQEDQKELERYIKELFHIDELTPKINKQLKDFREKYHYGYSGIRKSLIYFFDIQHNSIEKANEGIGIVPFVWEQAKKYFYNIEQAKERNKNLTIEQLEYSVREIHINSPKRNIMRAKRNPFEFLERSGD